MELDELIAQLHKRGTILRVSAAGDLTWTVAEGTLPVDLTVAIRRYDAELRAYIDEGSSYRPGTWTTEVRRRWARLRALREKGLVLSETERSLVLNATLSSWEDGKAIDLDLR